MFPRILIGLITGFWLVMAFLLLRLTYFPEGSQFARLPPATVFQTFLERGASGKTLHLYRGDKKVGHVNLDLRRMRASGDPDDFTLLLSGSLEKGVIPEVPAVLMWNIGLNLRDGQHWAGASGKIRLPDNAIILDFDWAEGNLAPTFSVLDHGVRTMDDKVLQPFLGPLMAGGANAAHPPLAGAGADAIIKVTAREGTMVIAGQKRKGRVIELVMFERHRVRAFFTELGELAMIELPGSYRALEPVIHGLVPIEPDEEES